VPEAIGKDPYYKRPDGINLNEKLRKEYITRSAKPLTFP